MVGRDGFMCANAPSPNWSIRLLIEREKLEGKN